MAIGFMQVLREMRWCEVISVSFISALSPSSFFRLSSRIEASPPIFESLIYTPWLRLALINISISPSKIEEILPLSTLVLKSLMRD